MPSLMTQAEYARHRGCSSVAVLKAIRAERITTISKDGKTWIDPEVADIQWAKNTQPRLLAMAAPAEGALDLPQREVSPPEAQLYDIQAARAKREHHEANLADLREQKAAGVLLERSRVERAAAAAAALVRAALEQLPSKLSPQLAAESDPIAVRALLAQAISECLTNLVDSLRSVTGASTDPDEPTH